MTKQIMLPREFSEIRKIAITAMFSDDQLMEQLVLKGGNAISLVLNLSNRTSIDLDFSLDGDFENHREKQALIERLLTDRFDSRGYKVFDFRFSPKPHRPRKGLPKFWGGYRVEFKVLEFRDYDRLGNLENRRRQAIAVAPGDKRIFGIDISKHEYCKAKQAVDLENFTVYVYTPLALVAEKLRALCQQMPDYEWIGSALRRPRPRDFYDIHTIAATERADFEDTTNLELVRDIFSAKQVPLAFLGRLRDYRDYHAQAFAEVQESVPERVRPFDFYFDSVVKLVERLEVLWNE